MPSDSYTAIIRDGCITMWREMMAEPLLRFALIATMLSLACVLAGLVTFAIFWMLPHG